MTTVGVVGLGIMGSAMAAHLLDDGFDVVGHDLRDDRRAALVDRGGRLAGSSGAVAAASDVVLTSLNHPQALLDVVLSEDGIAARAPAGLVVADTSTLPLDVKEAARHHLEGAGATLLDCTLSGTGAQAEERDLAVYGSGDPTAFEQVRPVFESVARVVHHLGPFGNGSRMKFVANHLVAIHNLATAEALLLGMQAGLDPATLVEVIAQGAGTSRIFELRGPLMVDERFRPPTASLETFAKDVAIIGDFAAEVGAPVPVFSSTLPFYDAAIAQDRGGDDAAALIAVLRTLVEGAS